MQGTILAEVTLSIHKPDHKMKSKLILSLLAIVGLYSCNTNRCPKDQTNTVLSENGSDTDLYQNEMTKLVKTQSDLIVYYFEERILKRGRSFLVLKVIGPEFCGLLHVLVDVEDEQSSTLQNGKDHYGCSLRGLKLYFNQFGTPIYKSMTRIVN